MKKFIYSIITLVTVLLGCVALNAQEYEPVFNKQNVSMFINGGVQTNLHDWNAPQGAVVNLGVNYQFTPIFGLTGEVGTGINNTRNWYSKSSHFKGFDFDQITAFIDGRVNLMNAFGGFTGEPRVFEIEPFAGIGCGHSFNKASVWRNTALGKVGINFNFNINHRWAINLSPAVIWNLRASNQHFMDQDYAVAQLTAGVTFGFPGYYGGEMERLVYTQTDLKCLNDEINFLREQANTPAVVREVEVVVEKVDTVYVETPVLTNLPVAFNVNSAKLPAYVPELNMIAENTTSETVVTVMGYASEDGDAAYNKALSLKRAEAVKAYLVNHGMKPEQVVVEGNGATEQFGKPRDYNRVVVLTVKR